MTAAVLAVLLLLVLGAVRLRQSRARALAEIRLAWGAPVERQRRMDAILASHRSRLAHEPDTGALDDRTWADLDLDAVFAALDRTTSTLGQHALYHRLRSVPRGRHPEAFETLTTRLAGDADLRERAQQALARLRDPLGYDLWWLAGPDAPAARPWFVVFPLLSAATALLVGTVIVKPALLPLLAVAFIANVLVRYLTDRRIGSMALAFRQIAPVVSTGEALRVLDTTVSPLTNALGRDTPPLGSLKTIARWVSGDPLMLPVDVDPLLQLASDAVSVVYEYVNLAFMLDGNGVFFGARRLRERAGELLRVVAAIGEVDAAVSVASFRAGSPQWVRPRFVEPGTTARLADIVHPLLDAPVPNSVDLPPGRGVLVTGSNMSGKSTFLRTVGVSAVIAQTLNTCLGSHYEAPVFRVRSSIGRADDLISGRSYYIVEVESLLALVEAASAAEPHLFLLDELFRGTNAVERIAAGRAVFEELTGRDGAAVHVAIAATHDSKLVDLLDDSYAAYHFGDDVGVDGLVFDHRLRRGPATTRNAIALLRQHGAPARLIARAMDTAANLDRQRGPQLEPR